MAFVPKLPTWQHTVEVYRKTADTWAAAGSIFGQVYTPLRNQDDEDGGLLYLMMPKEEITPPYKGNPGPFPWMMPRSPYDGIADVIEISLPGGNGVVAYEVRDVRPRWLAFPNEHILVDLQRLNTNQWNVSIHRPPPSPPPTDPDPPVVPTGTVPPQTLQVADIADDECTACEELNGEYDGLTYKGQLQPGMSIPYDHWETPMFDWDCSPSGAAFWRVTAISELKIGEFVVVEVTLRYPSIAIGGSDTIATFIGSVPAWDGSDIVVPFLSGTNECDFSATSITIEFDDPEPPGLSVHLASLGDDGCGFCADIVGDYPLTQQTETSWISDQFAWGCLPSNAAFWAIVGIVNFGAGAVWLLALQGVYDPWAAYWTCPYDEFDPEAASVFEFRNQESTGGVVVDCDDWPSITLS